MRIVVLDGHTLNPGDNPWTPLSHLGSLKVYPNSSPNELVERLNGAQIAITNKVHLRADVLDALPELRFISVTATGVNTIDLEATARRNIPVSNVPSYGSQTVAQFVFAQILHWCHKVAEHDTAIRNGKWAQNGHFSFWTSPQVELKGKTLGIIGFGKIGQSVATIATAFGMQTLVNTRTRSTNSFPAVEYTELAPLLARSDFVSLHCPLTATTQNMVNAEFLSNMQQRACLINTARGELVCEQDLAKALREGRIRAAALDVVSQEPISPSNPLLKAPNCLLTPHMAWAALESRQRLMQITAENVAAFINGTPQNIINITP